MYTKWLRSPRKEKMINYKASERSLKSSSSLILKMLNRHLAAIMSAFLVSTMDQ